MQAHVQGHSWLLSRKRFPHTLTSFAASLHASSAKIRSATMMNTACAASRAITRHMSAAAAGVGSAQGVNVAAAQQALLNADLVAFDVDSTVLNGEGIDALAALAGKGEEVAAWTAK